MAQTSIEWADDTRNWQSGCTEARRPDGTMDPACVHCYARLMSARMEAMGVDLYERSATRSGGSARWTGQIHADEALLWQHMRALRPGRVTFVGSMTDLFHEQAEPWAWRDLADAAREVSARPQDKRPRGMVTLTKRADRLLAFQREHFPEGLPSWWWAGVTVADQTGADLRLPALMELRTDGPRVVSYEPAMGPVDWRPWTSGDVRIGWLIAGGESGPKARPSHPDWFRAARDAAGEAGVPFFFKQWGEWRPVSSTNFGSGPHLLRRSILADGRVLMESVNAERDTILDAGGLREWHEDCEAHQHNRLRYQWMELAGKSAAGRLLDGREWSEVPL